MTQPRDRVPCAASNHTAQGSQSKYPLHSPGHFMCCIRSLIRGGEDGSSCNAFRSHVAAPKLMCCRSCLLQKITGGMMWYFELESCIGSSMHVFPVFRKELNIYADMNKSQTQQVSRPEKTYSMHEGENNKSCLGSLVSECILEKSPHLETPL